MESTGLDLDTDNDLAAAFATREASSTRQDGEDPEQDSDGKVEQPDSVLDPESGTPPSRPDGDSDSSPKDPDPLAGLTREQILAHPVLGREFQSWKDQEAAKQITPAVNRAREEERTNLRLQMARDHFDNLTEEQLAAELRDPQIKSVYQEVLRTPPPSPPEVVDAAVAFYARQLTLTTDEIAKSDLPEDVKRSLDPALHITKGGDPDEVMAAWQNLVRKAITDHEITKATSPTSPAARAKKLEEEAEADADRHSGALLESGRLAEPLPDFDKTSGDSLLTDAFARTERNRGRRSPVR